MFGSYFDEKIVQPDDALLDQVVGEPKKYWDEVVKFASEQCDQFVSEWKFYGKKQGWQLKLMKKKRALLYMVPHEGSFLAGMALNEFAMQALAGSGLPTEFIEQVENEKTYPEGQPARVEVTSKEHLEIVKKLIEIKLVSLG